MGWTVFQVVIAVVMVVTGSINTLSTKWANTSVGEDSQGKLEYFNHPFLQCSGMFLGEMLCMVAFYVHKHWIANSDPDANTLPFNPLILAPAGLLDLIATSTMYVGLTITYASSFQMLRGAVIIFTGILSRVLLKSKMKWFNWIGMVIITGGLLIVGTSDLLTEGKKDCDNTTTTSTLRPLTTSSAIRFDQPPHFYNSSHSSLDDPFYNLSDSSSAQSLVPARRRNTPVCDKICWWSIARNIQDEEGKCNKETENASNPVVGDILIICAQIVVACQMVYEQKFISKYNIPALKVVGWEGIFGFTTIVLLMIPMYFIKVGKDFGHGPEYRLEDALDGLIQLSHSWRIALATGGNVLSIAFFNFAGVSVTKELSATTRMVLDSVRTLVVWVFSILPFVQWQQFYFLQPIGFLVLIAGMFLYNDVILMPAIRKYILKNDPASGYATID